MRWRRIFLAILATLVFGSVAPNSASARGWRGGRGWGWGGAAVGLGLGLGLAAGYPYYAYGAGYPYGGYAVRGCWQRYWVDTPFGPRLRRVWVC
jgi:hypothetical protein